MSTATQPRTAINPWVIAMTVTLATFMEVLDTSIANVALPHIGGALSATQDESTWIISSYLVANAIVLPVSAYMTALVGRKRFYMSCVALFGISSLLCGLAPSLPLLLLFRVFQGAGGGGLAPSEQAILADTFPPEKRGQAFAMYGLAVVVAPTLGPTLGGWITDNYDWRWIFFINVPIALISLFLTNRFVEDTDAIKQEVAEAKKGKFRFDYMGFGLVALAFGSLEVVLDKGQEDDWFGSRFVTTFFWMFITGLVGFVCWCLWRIQQGEKPILDLRIFRNRNIAVSFVLMFAVGGVLYCTLTMLPQLMQTDLGYTAQLSGEALTAGGFALILCMPIVGVLVGKVDARWMIVGGFLTLAGSLYLSRNIDLQMSFGYIAELRVFQSLGLAFLFIPVNTLSYVGVRPDQSNDVSGLINLARNVGGSCGTALFASMLSRRSQVHQHYLMRYANDGHPAYVARIAALTQQAMGRAGNMVDARHHALAQFYQQLQLQASILSYIDIMGLLGLIALAMVPLPLLLKKPPKGAAAVAH